MKLASINLRLFEVKLPEILLDRPRAGPVLGRRPRPSTSSQLVLNLPEPAVLRQLGVHCPDCLPLAWRQLSDLIVARPYCDMICDERARFYQLLSGVASVAGSYAKTTANSPRKCMLLNLNFYARRCKFSKSPTNGTILRNKVTTPSELGLTACLASGASAGARLAFQGWAVL